MGEFLSCGDVCSVLAQQLQYSLVKGGGLVVVGGGGGGGWRRERGLKLLAQGGFICRRKDYSPERA
jgi:hypothetical protein